MRFKCVATLLAGALFGLLSLAVSATTLAELQAADKLRVKIWIEPKNNIIARQQINLQIEISSDTQFAGGTRIGLVEIDDAIVLQREKFALNSVLKEGNKNWVVQQWTLVVYPQRGGRFDIPEIPLRLSIAERGVESVVGEISTPALSFAATTPKQMIDKPGWVATTRYEVEESFDKPLDNLKPGDALIHTITITADNLPAMMLPVLKVEDISGVAVYSKLPQVIDTINRGEYLARRTEQITYIFEQAGDFQLPPQSFYWWNLDTQSQELITLAPHDLSITSENGASGEDDRVSLTKDINQTAVLIPLLKKAVFFLLLAVLIWYGRGRFRKRFPALISDRSAHTSERTLRKQFELACKKQELEKAMGLFYCWLDLYGGVGFKGSVRESLKLMDQAELAIAFNESMASIYGANKAKVDINLFARRFFKVLKTTGRPPGIIHLDVDLKLN